MLRRRIRRRSMRVIFLVTILFVMAVLVIPQVLVNTVIMSRLHWDDVSRELSNIAALKKAQIERWLEERQDDLRVTSGSMLL